MDKLQWFKFSPSDYMMGKIQRCPEITQARYLRLCCLYWNKECDLSIEDARIEVDDEHYEILLKKKVIKESDELVTIEFLDEQMEEITETSKSKSKAARARWEKYNSKKEDSTSNADAMHVHTDVMQSDAEKSKRREEKDKPLTPKGESFDFDSYIENINKLFGRNFRKANQKTRRQMKKTLKTYDKQNVWIAMQNCKNDPHHKESEYKYCTPEFFSREATLERHGDRIRKTGSNTYQLID